ncbi:MAG: carbamoyltransferase [Verrucomicrobia bacterium]|nr:carbamoyltransferase [Verrucomicrobiota bacterium]
MRILGISCYFHDASAALLEDGVLVAAAEEERFTRKKHDYEFPRNAINFCLDQGGITGKDLDYVAFFEKPFVKYDRLLKTALQGFPKTYGTFVQSMRTWMFDKLWIKSLIAKSVGIDPNRILFSEHHLSHAASAYFCSPFDEAAVLTFDGVGEWATTTMGFGHGNDLKISQELLFPHSIGLLYSAFTAFLGFEVNEGEYKVMGMAPYGSPRYVDKVWKVVSQNDDGSYWLDPKYFAFHHSTKRSYSSKLIELFGKPRDPDVPFFTLTSGYPSYYGPRPPNFNEKCRYNEHYADIAASIQVVTEELILSLARELHRQTGSKRLCLAGGVALNSVANSRILRETPFEELYIQPSAGDGGGSLGAALVVWHCALGNSKRFVMDHAYWGQAYSTDDIRAALDQAGIKYVYVDDQCKLVDITVDRLMSGAVVGWSQGRFEWGPRALGHRSILADPRRAEMKDVVNTKIKFREPFRPFAPSVLVEASEQYFDLPQPDRDMPARFMLLVVPVHEGKQDKIPAVSHMGTARIQTVCSDTSPLYHQLIERFGEATGVPVILNTSFNVRGEPIVNTPWDALNTFGNSGIDTLVMGNFLVDKR